MEEVKEGRLTAKELEELMGNGKDPIFMVLRMANSLGEARTIDAVLWGKLDFLSGAQVPL